MGEEANTEEGTVTINAKGRTLEVSYPLEVDIQPGSYIQITTQEGYEVIYWDVSEFQDPGVPTASNNAVHMAHTDPVGLIKNQDIHIVSDYMARFE